MAKNEELISSKDDKKSLAEKINTRYMQLLSAHRDQRLEWLVCAAFARGIHYAVIDSDHSTLITPQVPDGRKRSKINKVGTWVKHTRARLAAVRPDFEVEPLGVGEQEIQASLCGTAYLQHSSKIQKWAMKKRYIENLCAIFGNSFGYIRDVEDPTRMVALIQYDEAGSPIVEGGEEVVGLKPVEDVEWDVILPHNVLCSPAPGELDDKREVLVVFKRQLSYYEETYGSKGRNVQADALDTSGSWFDLSILSNTRADKDLTNDRWANEIIYLKKPSKGDPSGLFVIYAGGEILVRENWMYERMTSYPLTHFRYGPPEPGEFWTQSPIKDQVPIQKDYNEVASIILENISNMGHKKWMNPIGSGVRSINDLAGEIIDYVPGLRPDQSVVTPLPHYEVAYLNQISKDMEDVQMFHSVSRGTGTPNVRSRIGLDKLDEEDNTPLATTDDFFEYGFSDLGEKILRIAAEKLDTPRLIKYVGEGRRRTIDNFTKEMLDGAGRVKVRMVDGFLRNKGRTQSLVLEMFTNGMIVDNLGNKDAHKAQKMLQFAVPEMIYWKEDQQRDIQYEENDKLMSGGEIEVAPWEYHFIHLDVLEEMMNGSEWKGVVKVTPEIKANTIKHWEAHKQAILNALGGQLGAQQQGGQPQEMA